MGLLLSLGLAPLLIPPLLLLDAATQPVEFFRRLRRQVCPWGVSEPTPSVWDYPAVPPAATAPWLQVRP